MFCSVLNARLSQVMESKLLAEAQGGGGICNKTAHQIQVRVNACAVHAYISCERMRSACLKFVPQTWWRVRAAAPRTAYRSARCAAADFHGTQLFCRCDVGHMAFFSFFFAVLWSTRGTCRSTALCLMVCVKSSRARLRAKAWETRAVV